VSGTIRGYRIFTACRTVNGKIFRLNDHLERLYSSSEKIHMKPPMERDQLIPLLGDVVRKNQELDPEANFFIQIIFSGGLDGDSMKQSGRGAHLYVAVNPLKTPSEAQISAGVALATFAHQRLYPGVKLMNYIGAIVAHQTVAREKEAMDVLFVDPSDHETILEGSTFTIFFVDRLGKLVTPALDGRILDSVTRRVVMEIAAQRSEFETIERDVGIGELPEMKEAFIASTTRSVLPVNRIDRQRIGTGAPGPVTSLLMNLFRDYLDNH
jgi:branched-chain amino acid aminotransferase